MRKLVLGTVAALVLSTVAFAGPAEARCWMTPYGWHCWHPRWHPYRPYGYYGHRHWHRHWDRDGWYR